MYDKLVKSLRICEGACNKECVLYNSVQVDGDTCQNRLCAMAADAIEDLEFACNRYEKDYKALCEYLPKWIPVTVRLPEKDGCYLVAVKNDHQRRYSKTAWFSHGSWFARQDVTHWMPLPEPPKEE